jgi:hypothetical protein
MPLGVCGAKQAKEEHHHKRSEKHLRDIASSPQGPLNNVVLRRNVTRSGNLGGRKVQRHPSSGESKTADTSGKVLQKSHSEGSLYGSAGNTTDDDTSDDDSTSCGESKTSFPHSVRIHEVELRLLQKNQRSAFKEIIPFIAHHLDKISTSFSAENFSILNKHLTTFLTRNCEGYNIEITKKDYGMLISFKALNDEGFARGFLSDKDIRESLTALLSTHPQIHGIEFCRFHFSGKSIVNAISTAYPSPDEDKGGLEALYFTECSGMDKGILEPILGGRPITMVDISSLPPETREDALFSFHSSRERHIDHINITLMEVYKQLCIPQKPFERIVSEISARKTQLEEGEGETFPGEEEVIENLQLAANIESPKGKRTEALNECEKRLKELFDDAHILPNAILSYSTSFLNTCSQLLEEEVPILTSKELITKIDSYAKRYMNYKEADLLMLKMQKDPAFQILKRLTFLTGYFVTDSTVNFFVEALKRQGKHISEVSLAKPPRDHIRSFITDETVDYLFKTYRGKIKELVLQGARFVSDECISRHGKEGIEHLEKLDVRGTKASPDTCLTLTSLASRREMAVVPFFIKHNTKDHISITSTSSNEKRKDVLNGIIEELEKLQKRLPS